MECILKIWLWSPCSWPLYLIRSLQPRPAADQLRVATPLPVPPGATLKSVPPRAAYNLQWQHGSSNISSDSLLMTHHLTRTIYWHEVAQIRLRETNPSQRISWLCHTSNNHSMRLQSHLPNLLPKADIPVPKLNNQWYLLCTAQCLCLSPLQPRLALSY